MKRFIIAGALALMLLALVACGGTTTNSGGSTSGNTIVLKNLAFNPSSLSVSVGDTVTFSNEDNVPHHIVVGTDDLGQQQPGETKTWKAPADGTYQMKCIIHPSMTGQITVGSGGSTIGTAPAGGSSGGGY